MGTPITGTFMFTDLVGSTALASRLGPEATEELRQVHFGILRGAAAATGGIEVKSTGDGVMLMFTGPSRALSCAAAIQQGIDRHNTRAAEPLSVRIGLSMGEAVEDDGDYYGDCVVEAARLCDKATGGQILTTELLRAMVGRHSAQTFSSVGALELKGIPEPVAAVEVLWESESVAGEIALPSRLVGAAAEGLFGFFGRAEELDLLMGAAARARDESRTEVVLLAGEPGIGKTTLASQVSRTLHADGATVLFGHCAEGLALPYHPWVEALTHLVEHAPEELLTAHVDAHGAILARLVPALCRRVPQATPGDITGMADGERFALLEAIRALLNAAAANGLVVVLDDLQWADAASLQVLRHLLEGGTPPPMLVIVTYRDTDLTRDHPLTPFLADLRREPWVHRAALNGLSDKELLALMEGAAGHEMEADGLALAQALHRETDGNPFFTGEMLRHLYENGAIAFDDSGRYVLTVDLESAPLPGSVRDVVIRRVDRLPDDVGRVLTLASVIGREFDLGVLAAVADDDDEDTLLDHLEAAANAALVTEVGELPGRFRFEHALIQHTLYQDLGTTRRQRLHQRIAEALEETVGVQTSGHAELAHHWLAATRPSDAAKAIEYARLAGEEAVTALAPEDAIRWFTQALELQERVSPDDLTVRARLLTGLGTAQRHAGKPEFRAILLDAGDIAARLDDADLLVGAALAITSETPDYVDDPERLALLERAIARVAPDGATAARLFAALATATDPRDVTTKRDHAERAVAIARATGDESTLLDVALRTQAAAMGPDNVASYVDTMEEAVAIADRLDDGRARFLARYQLAEARIKTGDVQGADEAFAVAAEIADALRLPYPTWQVLIERSGRAARAGDFRTAEALADQALALATSAGFAAGFGVYGGQLYDVRTAQGRGGEIVDFFVDAAEAMPMIEALRTAVILLLITTGARAQARERYERERADGFEYPMTSQWYNTIDSVADAAVDLADRAGAEVLLARMRPYSGHLAAPLAVSPRPLARSIGRLAGLLGLDGEADAAFTAALDLCERLGSPFWTARTLVDRAEWLSRRGAPGDSARADADIDAALDLADQIGAASIPQCVERLRAGA
ncbi:MAG: hypothetical protein AMXMBFR46_04330 [Acidimicrobiia bacterium]